MPKPWEKYQGVAVEESGPWDKYRGTVEEPKTDILTTVGRASAQGASLGWGDELSPLVEKGIAKYKQLPSWLRKTAGIASPTLGALDALTPEMSSEAYDETYGKKSYKDLRDIYREENREAKKSHPFIYGASEIAASMPALIATAGKATAPAKLAAIGAGQGATMTGGTSEAEGIGLVRDIALGGAVGGTLGYGGGKLAQLIKPKVKPGSVIADEKLAQEAVEKQTAKTATSEAPELVEGAAKAAVKEVRPPVTNQDKLIASLQNKDANVVAYGRTRGGEKILQESPSLDSNVPNNLRSRFDEAMERVGSKIDDYEQQAGELIEKSNLKMANSDIANTIQKSMDEIKNSGRYATESGKAAYKTLKRKLSSFVVKSKDGTVLPKEGTRSAKWLREYIQGLREENKAFFSKVASGNEYSSAQDAVQDLTKNIDEVLKSKVTGYRKLMQAYSKDLRAYMGVKKSMGRQTVADFFTNKVKKPAQDMLFGTREPAEKWVNTLKDFGDAAGDDILGMAKDRLAYAHLFPNKVTAAEMPSITQTAASFGHALLKMPLSPKLGAFELVRASVDPVKRGMFERALESTVDPAAKKTLYLRLAEKIQKMKPAAEKTRAATSEIMESPVTKAAGMETAMQAIKPEPEDKNVNPVAAQQFNKTYAPVLKNAIKRGGGHSFAVTNYLLQQKDPNYRQLLKDVYENEE